MYSTRKHLCILGGNIYVFYRRVHLCIPGGSISCCSVRVNLCILEEYIHVFLEGIAIYVYSRTGYLTERHSAQPINLSEVEITTVWIAGFEGLSLYVRFQRRDETIPKPIISCVVHPYFIQIYILYENTVHILYSTGRPKIFETGRKQNS